MENSTLSPASITQKVIAMQTTKKEVCQKLLAEKVDKNFAGKLEKSLDQINHFTGQLMNELSNYGDAVSSQIDRNEEYEKMANDLMDSNNQDKEDEKEVEFEKFEEKSRNIYRDILSDKNELPASLKNIIEEELSRIS